MANVLPKIINNDPEGVTISSTAQVVASDEFEFVINGTTGSLALNSELAEVGPNYGYTSSVLTYTVLSSGKFSIFASAFVSGYARVAPDGISYYDLISISGFGAQIVNVFLNKGAKIQFTNGGAFHGCGEGYTNACYLVSSGDSVNSVKYTRSAFKNIT